MKPARGHDEDARVDLRNPADLDAWAKRLGVPADEFRRAAEQAGPRIGDIRQHLVGGFSSSGPSS